MAKKIRLYDLTELEIENITQAGDSLRIEFKGMSLDDLIATFKVQENLQMIQYYVNTTMMTAYAGFIIYESAEEIANGIVTINQDVLNESTPSGFEETYEDLQKIVIRKKNYNERLVDLEQKVGV